jgi:hypothetical protein
VVAGLAPVVLQGEREGGVHQMSTARRSFPPPVVTGTLTIGAAMAQIKTGRGLV